MFLRRGPPRTEALPLEKWRFNRTGYLQQRPPDLARHPSIITVSLCFYYHGFRKYHRSSISFNFNVGIVQVLKPSFIPPDVWPDGLSPFAPSTHLPIGMACGKRTNVGSGSSSRSWMPVHLRQTMPPSPEPFGTTEGTRRYNN